MDNPVTAMFNKLEECSLAPEEVDNRAQGLLQQLSLKEKVLLLNGEWDFLTNVVKYKNPYNPTPIPTTGCKRLGITPIKFSDGPRGVVMGNATCFPVSMARGASFDTALEKAVGDAIGIECRALGANYFGGVCINLLRHPAWGRAQETYGEDPFHVGEMGKALTVSVQHHNVMACLKHYAVNNIENSRFRVNVKADERTLHEVYLPHFKKSVDAGAASLMGAYNLYQGEHCCESDYLLNKVLRDDWGFAGFTLSDFFFGIRDGVKAIKAGMDVEMPLPINFHHHLITAVEEGGLQEATLDQSVLRVIRTLLVFENTPDPDDYSEERVASKAHVELAQKTAEQSMVLLKNEHNVLPLSRNIKQLLVVGRLADKSNLGDHGSSRVRPPASVSYLQGVRAYVGEEVVVHHCTENDAARAEQLAKQVDAVLIIAGYDFMAEGEALVPDPKSTVGFELVPRGMKNLGRSIQAFLGNLLMPIVLKAAVTKGGDDTGGDRSSLTLDPPVEALIKTLGEINSNTVVSLVTGSMIITESWDKHVQGIIYSWYSGMQGGSALARLLFGEVNPSGKLPFVQPRSEQHLPYFSSEDDDITYDLYHGYTLLDRDNIRPAYPFGFGLSYTRFAYSDMAVEDHGSEINVSVTVSNTGERGGAEVVQVYAGMKNSGVERQRKLLKGFAKIGLAAGESKRVSISVGRDELRYFDVDTHRWLFEAGKYDFYAGSSSSEDDLLVQSISLGGS